VLIHPAGQKDHAWAKKSGALPPAPAARACRHRADLRTLLGETLDDELGALRRFQGVNRASSLWLRRHPAPGNEAQCLKIEFTTEDCCQSQLLRR
jgi:hypothetical protein